MEDNPPFFAGYAKIVLIYDRRIYLLFVRYIIWLNDRRVIFK